MPPPLHARLGALEAAYNTYHRGDGWPLVGVCARTGRRLPVGDGPCGGVALLPDDLGRAVAAAGRRWTNSVESGHQLARALRDLISQVILAALPKTRDGRPGQPCEEVAGCLAALIAKAGGAGAVRAALSPPPHRPLIEHFMDDVAAVSLGFRPGRLSPAQGRHCTSSDISAICHALGSSTEEGLKALTTGHPEGMSTRKALAGRLDQAAALTLYDQIVRMRMVAAIILKRYCAQHGGPVVWSCGETAITL